MLIMRFLPPNHIEKSSTLSYFYPWLSGNSIAPQFHTTFYNFFIRFYYTGSVHFNNELLWVLDYPIYVRSSLMHIPPPVDSVSYRYTYFKA